MGHGRLAAAALALAGCSFQSSYDDTRFRCEDDRGCPAGASCSGDGFCEAGEPGDPDGAPVGDTDGAPIDVPPVLVTHAETTWTMAATGATKQTAEIDVLAGDILLAYGISEDDGVGLSSISGGAQNWSVPEVSVSEDHPWVGVWTAEVDIDRSMAVSFTLEADVSGSFGGGVLVFRGSSGLGASAKDLGAGSARVDLVATRPHSAVAVAVGDWNAQDGSARQWLEDAGELDEMIYFRDPDTYTAFAGVHLDTGPADSYPVGLLSPGNQVYGLVAVEVLGGTD
ncbi:MAG TPA: hypothetical protein VMZ28_25880 [Kofleriaceae bacterium]|nr:hypothetical protein [Kofleriaceae bacterium]